MPPARLARAIERVRHHIYRLHQRLAPAPVVLTEMILATWMSQAITVAAELGVADALADGPQPIGELAGRVGADPDALARLLRALVSRGVFRLRRDGRHELNPLADTLRRGAFPSMAGAAQLYGSRRHREHWSLLADSVRTGKPVIPALRGMELFDYLAQEPELGELFNQAMTSGSELAVTPVVAAYDFGAYPTIVDVGGGHGRLLAAIVAATPRARGVLYDLPQVVAGAAALLVELVIPEHDREFIGKWLDLEMLHCLAAHERTAAEYRGLLEQAGFRMTRVVQTASPFSVVEATAV